MAQRSQQRVAVNDCAFDWLLFADGLRTTLLSRGIAVTGCRPAVPDPCRTGNFSRIGTFWCHLWFRIIFHYQSV